MKYVNSTLMVPQSASLGSSSVLAVLATFFNSAPEGGGHIEKANAHSELRKVARTASTLEEPSEAD